VVWRSTTNYWSWREGVSAFCIRRGLEIWNNDDRNEVFRPIIAGYEGWRYKLTIFDRWGLAIWSTEDRNVGWDGRKDGAEPVIDVYVWKVILERDGDAHDFIVHVTLLR
jgi:gliding motility-associated-like protein